MYDYEPPVTDASKATNNTLKMFGYNTKYSAAILYILSVFVRRNAGI
jgi:hypothetical protein